MGGSVVGSQCDVCHSEHYNCGAVTVGQGGKTHKGVNRVLLTRKVGALKARTAGERGLIFPPFLACDGKINLEGAPPDLTVVVKHTCLEDEMIGFWDNLRWQLGHIAR